MNAIHEALAPVLRDVASTTDVELPASISTGVYLNLADSEAERILTVTAQIQEIVIEELWARASNWPMCPAHRSSHPMEAALKAGEAWWTCPADAAPVVRIGALRL